MHAGRHLPLPRHRLHTLHPDGTVIGVVIDLPMHVHAHPQGQARREGMIDRVHPQAGGLHPLVIKQTRASRAIVVNDPEETSRGFFEQAQTHGGKSALPASVATSTPL